MLIFSFEYITLYFIGEINIINHRKIIWLFLILLVIFIYILKDLIPIKYRLQSRLLNDIKDSNKMRKIKLMNENEKFLTIKNAEGEPDTIAKIILQNKINYIPKVSVIIPVYNTGEYLDKCLETVTNQTLKEIEIICIDDGSTDNSLEILISYAEKDERITIIKQQNLHSGVARNAGLAVAKGKYLSFLDSDDFFELNMLELMYKRILKKQCDIIICKCKSIDLDTGKMNEHIFNNSLRIDLIKKKNKFSASEFSKMIFQICEGWAWDKLFRTEFILHNGIKFQNLLHYNDNQFTYTAICLAKSITITKKRLIIKRHGHKKSLSATRNRDPSCFLLAFNKLKLNLEKLGLYSKFKDSLWKWIIKITMTQLRHLNSESKILVFNILKQNFNIWNYINLYPSGSSIYRSLFYLKNHNDYPTISIVYLANGKNFNYFLVSLVSILRNSEFENLNFIIIYKNITLLDLQKINELKKIRSFNLQTLNISNIPFHYISSKKAFLGYILISNLQLIKNIDKVLYLSCNTIVRKSLISLLEIDMNNKLIAGVEDISFSKKESKKLYLKDNLYINDNVILFNLKEWKKSKPYYLTKFFNKNNNIY